MADLSTLGWNSEFEASFQAVATPGLVRGRVALEHNHVYRVFTEDGEWLAEAAGRLKFHAAGREELPAVGDWVGLIRGASSERAVIRVILPRRSCFSRKAAGRGTDEQIIAANIDTAFIVFSLDGEPKLRAIERYLVLVRHSGAQPAVVLNKADRADDLAGAVQAVTDVAAGVPVHAVSARDGRGLEELDVYLGGGRTVALLGPSGAGKSTIVNRLAGRDLLATGDVRSWDARGRHTSVHRQLIALERGGMVIDTPGMRELQMWEADEAVDDTFEDVLEQAGACRFRDCRHESEPGCAVKAATENGHVDPSRYAAYLKLAREREAFEARQDERGWIERKRQGKIAQKALRVLEKKRDRS